eukprot:NODE_54_length_26799_cov_0.554794.p5 type:complete len:372 gc:universal NODE_54_length_26799_cov_0.554794:13214-12099(-)
MIFSLICAIVFIDKSNSTFGSFIEGAGVDPTGVLFATNGHMSTAEILSTNHQNFRSKNSSHFFNGIKWAGNDVFYAIEVTENKIYKYDGGFKEFCKHPDGINGMSNDIVLHENNIFVSGQKYTPYTKIGDGQIWMCDKLGRSKVLAHMGRTNGIAVHPDGQFLYVTEAFNTNSTPSSNKIYKFKFKNSGIDLSSKDLVVDFNTLDNSGHIDVDGIRFDATNRLYTTRNGAGRVSIFLDTLLERNINISFNNPANLEIINKTLFVVGRCESEYGQGLGCIDVFDVDADGLEQVKLRRLVDETQQSQQSNLELGLIIGLTVGLSALIMLIILFVHRSFTYRRKLQKKQSEFTNQETMLPFVPRLHDLVMFNKE